MTQKTPKLRFKEFSNALWPVKNFPRRQPCRIPWPQPQKGSKNGRYQGYCPKSGASPGKRPAILQRTKALSSDNASRNSSFTAFSTAGAKAKMAFVFCRTRSPSLRIAFVKYLFPGEKASLQIRQGSNRNAGKAQAAIASISLIPKDAGKRRALAAQLVKKVWVCWWTGEQVPPPAPRLKLKFEPWPFRLG